MFVAAENLKIFAVLAVLSLAAPVVAQETQPDPIADTPPSLRGFSLPPSDPQPDTRTQGPVDGETAPPRAIVRPNPQPEQPPTRTQAQPQPTAPRSQPVGSARQPVVPQVTTATPADAPEPQAVDPDTPVSSGDPQSVSPLEVEPQGPQSIPITVTETAPAGSINWPFWIMMAAIAALLLAAFVLLLTYLRRSRAAQLVEAEADPVPADSPPLPVTPSAPPPAPAVAPTTTPPLGLNFTARTAAATLVNAVVGFRLIIRNTSEHPLTDVRVCGDLVTAHAARSEAELLPDANARLVVLEDIAALAPGDTYELTGEMRLPLNAIAPMMIGKRALFVPVARFAMAARLPDGSDSPTQLFAYLVGQESNPPQGKLAPFRLDLGPRDFVGLGQRRLAA